jgi:hypothetical protein
MRESCYNHERAIFTRELRKLDRRAGVLLVNSQQRRTQVILPEITPLWTG